MQPNLYTLAPIGQGKISTMARPRAGDWLDDEINGLRLAGVTVLVSLLTPPEVLELDLAAEETSCRTHGIRFISFPIPDYGLPSSEHDVDALTGTLREALSEGRHVAIHCRQGIGRSSLVAASLVVSLGVGAEDALLRIEEARGRPVPDTDEQRAWVVAYARRYRERLIPDSV